MKICQPIGTPGTALPHVRHAAAAVRWGADMSRFVEIPLRDYVRPNVASDSLVLDGPVIKSASLPPPSCKRSP